MLPHLPSHRFDLPSVDSGKHETLTPFPAVLSKYHPSNTEEDSPQTTLFTVGRYSYHAFVTNFRIWPIAVYRVYNDRAAMENIIKELKADYSLAKIPTPTGHFAANETYFHLLLFAYNLVHWFQRLCLPPAYHAMTLGTLRRQLLMLPGEFVHPNNVPTLRLPSLMPERDVIEHALRKIHKLKF